ncbi:MAG: SUMF1/EgtB/PvdO family nonheme iron enzyme [Thiothrix sp.]
MQQQRWVGAEVEVALSRKLSPHDDCERLPIFPVLLPEAAFDGLPVFLKQIQSLIWRPASELPQGLLEALQVQTSLQTVPPLLKGEPYRGLSYFRHEDAARFFGRHEEVLQALRGLGYAEDLVPETSTQPHSRYYRWLQIHAASGAGKSSLVHAGLLPKIEKGLLWRRTGYADWKILEPMMPGEKPVEMLAEKLAKAFPQQNMGAWRVQLSDPALLVVDQFEELFTLAEDAERRQFDRLLTAALADHPDCPLFLISAIRSDFLDRFEYLPELLRLYNTHKSDYLLPTIAEAGLRELIVYPARLAGLQADADLVEAIVRDARDEPGVLPLVESALAELWNDAQAHGSQRLSKAYYERNNGVVGMLAKQALKMIRRFRGAMLLVRVMRTVMMLPARMLTPILPRSVAFRLIRLVWYDMHGNVYEWCQDVYGDYPAEPVRNPEGSPDSANRVLRGGLWGSTPWNVRSANRGGSSPDYRNTLIGFRLASGQ